MNGNWHCFEYTMLFQFEIDWKSIDFNFYTVFEPKRHFQVPMYFRIINHKLKFWFYEYFLIAKPFFSTTISQVSTLYLEFFTDPLKKFPNLFFVWVEKKRKNEIEKTKIPYQIKKRAFYTLEHEALVKNYFKRFTTNL